MATFIIVTVLIALPLVVLIPPKVILQRFEVTTGRPKLEDIEKSIKFILQDREVGVPFANIIHNRRFIIGQTYFGNYLSHFDFNFLFTKGDDNFRHHIQDMGMLYLFELPLFVSGIYLFIKNRSKPQIFILAWLLISPIAATPAVPNPHANRSLPMIITLELISAYALFSILGSVKSYKKLFVTVGSLIILISFLVYLHNYYQHYAVEKASFWQYGYKEAVLASQQYKDQFEKVIVDKKIEQAYAFWLFNTRYDPAKYQQNGSRYNFDKYYFDSQKLPQSETELFISDPSNFPQSFILLKTIYFPDGIEAIKIGHKNGVK